MNGDSYNIIRAEGGFIVYANKQGDQPSDSAMIGGSNSTMVFADSSKLLNFLHNEFVGSN